MQLRRRQVGKILSLLAPVDKKLHPKSKLIIKLGFRMQFLLFPSEPAGIWCKKAERRYSMLFKDSVMLMFSSRRDMAMLTMKAKTKVRITARA